MNCISQSLPQGADLDNYPLSISVQFLRPQSEILAFATQIGRGNGLDEDWEATNIDEAIHEILLFSKNSSESGVVFLPCEEAGRQDVFTSKIILTILDAPEDIIAAHQDVLPIGFTSSFDNVLLGCLNSDKSPADCGFSIGEYVISNPNDEPRDQQLFEHCFVPAQISANQAQSVFSI